MTKLFTVEELKSASLVPPFAWTKGVPLLRIAHKSKAGSETHSYHFPEKMEDTNTVLYDLEADPGQTTPIDDPAVEARLKEALFRMMAENDAPARGRPPHGGERRRPRREAPPRASSVRSAPVAGRFIRQSATPGSAGISSSPSAAARARRRASARRKPAPSARSAAHDARDRSQRSRTPRVLLQVVELPGPVAMIDAELVAAVEEHARPRMARIRHPERVEVLAQHVGLVVVRLAPPRSGAARATCPACPRPRAIRPPRAASAGCPRARPAPARHTLVRTRPGQEKIIGTCTSPS